MEVAAAEQGDPAVQCRRGTASEPRPSKCAGREGRLGGQAIYTVCHASVHAWHGVTARASATCWQSVAVSLHCRIGVCTSGYWGAIRVWGSVILCRVTHTLLPCPYSLAAFVYISKPVPSRLP